jgi:signal transduction histidine kinase
VTVSEKRNPPKQNVIHICEDISERKRLEQIVESQDKLALLGKLTSSIMHEILNPLESIRDLVYLARQMPPSEELREFLTTAEEEIGHVAHIAAQTLEFHRRGPEATSVDVVVLLQSVMSLFRARLQQNTIAVHVDKTDPTPLKCFSSEIRQVIANLVSNAIDAMPKGGTLRLKVRKMTDWRNHSPGVRITVADTGVGMSHSTRRRIYDSFFTTKGAKGTGLGL